MENAGGALGTVYSNEEEIPMADVSVILHNLDDGWVDSLITNENGEYNFVLDRHTNYKVEAHKEGYLPDETEFHTRDVERGIITNDLLLEEEYIDKSVVFFDYNKSNLRSDAIYELKRMLEILSRNPEDIMVISAHADSRGTHEYNQKLSEKRAKAAKDYFINNGISEARITARGFGESLLINRCTSDIDCHEVEHSKNRRAELKLEEPN